MRYEPAFIQITASGKLLYALDSDGGVWKYFPATTYPDGEVDRFSAWVRLTQRRKDGTGRRPQRER